MSIGLPELILLILIIGTLVLPVWSIIDAATRPESTWRSADQSKIVWVLVILFVPLIGSLVYLISIRPKLAARARP